MCNSSKKKRNDDGQGLVLSARVKVATIERYYVYPGVQVGRGQQFVHCHRFATLFCGFSTPSVLQFTELNCELSEEWCTPVRYFFATEYNKVFEIFKRVESMQILEMILITKVIFHQFNLKVKLQFYLNQRCKKLLQRSHLSSATPN